MRIRELLNTTMNNNNYNEQTQLITYTQLTTRNSIVAEILCEGIVIIV